MISIRIRLDCVRLYKLAVFNYLYLILSFFLVIELVAIVVVIIVLVAMITLRFVGSGWAGSTASLS